mmetsp:Transcript_21960/g.37055  ORF Transcript_21960/g.37055 Transcript_21960/m.37055 type:complete len:155 (-) Transcript_21960:168-632(-)|eukprot:CAMPEP_0174975614 /NCGR_PEP_ID=MMETSP0004_2-20121128/12545_1 /TAXON_ID=420556 /ORGANISM="Ochromonas sp., Strain CCMP1393" /LENGTH=154 /DNA_ID=CAMNT_0016226493 /DNA_START=39 /DNA_END=503 /DNA_ORIENTATION=-
MAAIDLPSEYGYVILVAVALWIQQSIIFAIPVGIIRSKTKIQPPVMYPTDKVISALKLKESQVDEYLRTQRVHQNNVEFLVTYFPILFLSGFQNPVHAAIAGVVVWLGRMTVALGYWQSAGKRVYGAWYNFPMLYQLYMVASLGLSLVWPLVFP